MSKISKYLRFPVFIDFFKKIKQLALYLLYLKPTAKTFISI